MIQRNGLHGHRMLQHVQDLQTKCTYPNTLDEVSELGIVCNDCSSVGLKDIAEYATIGGLSVAVLLRSLRAYHFAAELNDQWTSHIQQLLGLRVQL